MASGTKREYPFEIESENKTRWVWTSNTDGNIVIDGNSIDTIYPTCDEIVSAIETGHVLWPKGSCAYMGPLRTEASHA